NLRGRPDDDQRGAGREIRAAPRLRSRRIRDRDRHHHAPDQRGVWSARAHARNRWRQPDVGRLDPRLRGRTHGPRRSPTSRLRPVLGTSGTPHGRRPRRGRSGTRRGPSQVGRPLHPLRRARGRRGDEALRGRPAARLDRPGPPRIHRGRDRGDPRRTPLRSPRHRRGRRPERSGVMSFRDELLALGGRAEASVIEVYRRFLDATITRDQAVELLAVLVQKYNLRAATLADLSLSATLMVETATPVPVTATSRVTELERLAKAASTVLVTAEASDVPEAIVARLARSETFNAGQAAYTEGI